MTQKVFNPILPIVLSGAIAVTCLPSLAGCVSPKPAPTPSPSPTPTQPAPAPAPAPTSTPEPIITPTPEPTPTPILSTPAVTPNPVEEYAKSIDLPQDFIDRVKILGKDGTIDDGDKAIVDFLKKYPDMSIVKLAEDEKIDIIERQFVDLASQIYDKRMVETLVKEGINEDTIKALTYLSKQSEDVRKNILDFGLHEGAIPWLVFNSTLEEKFAEYVVKNKLCIQDRKLTDLEINFLKNPDTYIKELFDSYLSQINEVSSELAMELKKLPDFKQIEMEDVETLEDILAFTPYESVGKISFESILNEGIKDKRKYSSSLEALLWILKDYEKEYVEKEPWEDYFSGPYFRTQIKYKILFSDPLIKLVSFSWEKASTSNFYHAERWQGFGEVIDRLNSPRLVSTYMIVNIKGDAQARERKERTGRWYSPRETFEEKKGACNEQARFALYSLLENGFYYDNFEKYKDNAACGLAAAVGDFKYSVDPDAHMALVYIDDGKFYLIDNGIIRGSYSTIEEAAEQVRGGWTIYQFEDANYNVTKEVRRY